MSSFGIFQPNVLSGMGGRESSVQQKIRMIISWIWVFAPFVILVLGSTVYRPTKEAGACVPWRPTSEMYGITWGILCLFLSISWIAVCGKAPFPAFVCIALLFALVIALSVTWLGVYYNNDKKPAMSVLVGILLLVVILVPVAFQLNVWSGALLCPLFMWLVLQIAVGASELSCAEI